MSEEDLDTRWRLLSALGLRTARLESIVGHYSNTAAQYPIGYAIPSQSPALLRVVSHSPTLQCLLTTINFTTILVVKSMLQPTNLTSMTHH